MFFLFGLLSFSTGFGQLNAIVVRKDSVFFKSYTLFFFYHEGEKIDSIQIWDPLQDILDLYIGQDGNSVLVVYASDGTNKITKGITLTFVRYELADGKAIAASKSMLLWAANAKIRRFRYSYFNNQLVFTDRKNGTCSYVYKLFDFPNTSALVSKISTDLTNSPCAHPD